MASCALFYRGEPLLSITGRCGALGRQGLDEDAAGQEQSQTVGVGENESESRPGEQSVLLRHDI